MKKLAGKIILVDDERYEKALLEVALEKMEWDIEIEYFSSASDALKYLKNTKDEIFIVISDMNMPKMNGLDFKKAIDNDKDGIFEKSIPFIFFSSNSTKEEVTLAYNYRVQGYFKKPLTVDEQAAQIDIIIKYWIIARHPNKDST